MAKKTFLILNETTGTVSLEDLTVNKDNTFSFSNDGKDINKNKVKAEFSPAEDGTFNATVQIGNTTTNLSDFKLVDCSETLANNSKLENIITGNGKAESMVNSIIESATKTIDPDHYVSSISELKDYLLVRTDYSLKVDQNNPKDRPTKFDRRSNQDLSNVFDTATKKCAKIDEESKNDKFNATGKFDRVANEVFTNDSDANGFKTLSSQIGIYSILKNNPKMSYEEAKTEYVDKTEKIDYSAKYFDQFLKATNEVDGTKKEVFDSEGATLRSKLFKKEGLTIGSSAVGIGAIVFLGFGTSLAAPLAIMASLSAVLKTYMSYKKDIDKKKEEIAKAKSTERGELAKLASVSAGAEKSFNELYKKTSDSHNKLNIDKLTPDAMKSAEKGSKSSFESVNDRMKDFRSNMFELRTSLGSLLGVKDPNTALGKSLIAERLGERAKINPKSNWEKINDKYNKITEKYNDAKEKFDDLTKDNNDKTDKDADKNDTSNDKEKEPDNKDTNKEPKNDSENKSNEDADKNGQDNKDTPNEQNENKTDAPNEASNDKAGLANNNENEKANADKSNDNSDKKPENSEKPDGDPKERSPKDDEIANLKAELGNKDKEIAGLKDALASKDKEIAEMKAEFEAKISDLEEKLSGLEEKVDNIASDSAENNNDMPENEMDLPEDTYSDDDFMTDFEAKMSELLPKVDVPNDNPEIAQASQRAFTEGKKFDALGDGTVSVERYIGGNTVALHCVDSGNAEFAKAYDTKEDKTTYVFGDGNSYEIAGKTSGNDMMWIGGHDVGESWQKSPELANFASAIGTTPQEISVEGLAVYELLHQAVGNENYQAFDANGISESIKNNPEAKEKMKDAIGFLLTVNFDNVELDNAIDNMAKDLEVEKPDNIENNIDNPEFDDIPDFENDNYLDPNDYDIDPSYNGDNNQYDGNNDFEPDLDDYFASLDNNFNENDILDLE